jgi:hypothetical protein
MWLPGLDRNIKDKEIKGTKIIKKKNSSSRGIESLL